MYGQLALLAALASTVSAGGMGMVMHQTSASTVTMSSTPTMPSSTSPACATSLQSYASALHAQEPSLLSTIPVELPATALSAICAQSTALPASVTAAAASYHSAAYAFLSTRSQDIVALASACPEVETGRELAAALAAYDSWADEGCGSTTTSSGGSEAAVAADAQTSTGLQNAAPRETGSYALGAMAMGIVGAAVVL
ncbi:hypothetical protein F5Y15DRAFT_351128 [Xylariaceae sp. FL0016]|nr:hypothetical protein F5Y15DRAFT_351128 [Xylariaceae sp. FL0016]